MKDNAALAIFNRFPVETEVSEQKALTVQIRTDIDIQRYPCNTEVNPLDFNLMTTEGRYTVDVKAMLRYLKAKRIVYFGTVPFMFDGCVYSKIDNSEVARIINLALDRYDGAPVLSKAKIGDIIFNLQTISQERDIEIPSEWDEEGLYEYDELIPFDNGIYNFVHDRFLRFTPNVFLMHQLGATYNPRITDHPVEEYYKKILPNPDTRRFFYEMLGYSLFSNEMYPPAIFVIYGPAKTGKSALHKAVTELAGFNNISSLDLTQISQGYTTAELLGKLINICGETGGSKQARPGYGPGVDGELLKRLSDGQAITVREIYGRPFEFRNRAKLWFITNTIPDFGDTSSGIYRRVFIIPCRHEQDDSERIHDKMCTPDAISWLANKALQGYRDFIANDRNFHVSSECMVESKSYKQQDSVMDFFDVLFGTTSRYVIPTKVDGWMVADLYSKYREYCREAGGKEMGQKRFSEKIRNEFSMITTTVHTTKYDGSPTTGRMFVNPKTK